MYMECTVRETLDTNFLVLHTPFKTDAPFFDLNSETSLCKEPKNISDCMQCHDGSTGTTLDPSLFWPYNKFIHTNCLKPTMLLVRHSADFEALCNVL
jgi:hypothetical protein